ncbi:MAG: SoxR reducing system RseC family protein [Clostridia bacterium]|nr:SoxR reducing system RseC family protein [Clostridia bacterium]
MERTGEVIAIEGNRLLVEFCRPTACEKCGGCEGGQKARMLVKGEAKVGDWVVVSLPTAQVMKASAMAYLWPLIALMGGLVLGNALGGGNPGALAGGIIGLVVATVAIRLWDQKRKKAKEWEAEVVQVLTAAEAARKET